MRIFAVLLLPFVFVFTACRPSAAPVSISNRPIFINDIPQTNLPMPPAQNVENLGWQTFDGKKQKISDFKGKVVVLDFWATYCPPCVEAIPFLVEQQSKNANLQIIGLHVGGEEDRRKVPAFAEKLKINYPLAYPEDDLTAAMMGNNSAIPQTFVFDRNGKLVEKFVGFDARIKIEIDRAIQKALNQS